MKKQEVRLKEIILRGKKLHLPAFFPDATFGQIKGLDNKKLRKIDVDGVVETVVDQSKGRLGNKPEESMKIINGIGFRLVDAGDLLILGEN